MAHSEYEGAIRGLSAYLVEDDCVDAGAVRDAVVNNLAHLADEATQVRINYRMLTGGSPLQVPVATPSADLAYFVEAFPFIATIYEGGGPTLILLARGKVDIASTATWHFVVHPVGPVGSGRGSPIAEASVSTSSLTYADLTAVTLTPTQFHVERARRALPTLASEDASGNPSGAEIVMMQLEVWVTTDTDQALGQLSGLMMREYVGV